MILEYDMEEDNYLDFLSRLLRSKKKGGYWGPLKILV